MGTSYFISILQKLRQPIVALLTLMLGYRGILPFPSLLGFHGLRVKNFIPVTSNLLEDLPLRPLLLFLCIAFSARLPQTENLCPLHSSSMLAEARRFSHPPPGTKTSLFNSKAVPIIPKIAWTDSLPPFLAPRALYPARNLSHFRHLRGPAWFQKAPPTPPSMLIKEGQAQQCLTDSKNTTIMWGQMPYSLCP